MNRTIAVFTVVAVLALGALAGDSGSWTGKISDDKCGAKADPECAKRCIEKGAKAVFVSDADGKVIAIANPDKVAGHEGHHVKVTGKIEGDTLTIDELTMVQEKGGK